MSALKNIKRMQESHEAYARKYEGATKAPDVVRYNHHVLMADSYRISAKYVQEARSIMLTVALLGTVVAGIVAGYFVER